MNIITDAPVVVNGEINKTAFSNLKKADFSETGDYTFLKNEFKEGFYSMDGDSYKPPFLSKNVKIGLIIGGSVLTLGILGYFIFRKK